MQQPTRLISTPFAQEGEKTEIQNVTGELDNSATYRLGFPPITMQSIRLGGKPPKGTDFNGVLFDITENISFLCKGGRYQYNAGLSTLIGGYPEGSNLLLDDNVTEVVSTVAGNQNNPNTDMTGWILKPNRTTAVNVADASGETQQQVNYNGGSKWHSRAGGYKENERVVLANGDIVRSTIDGNMNDPNVNITGWVNTNRQAVKFLSAKEIGLTKWATFKKPPYTAQEYEQAYNNGLNLADEIKAANDAGYSEVVLEKGNYPLIYSNLTASIYSYGGAMVIDGVRDIDINFNGSTLFVLFDSTTKHQFITAPTAAINGAGRYSNNIILEQNTRNVTFKNATFRGDEYMRAWVTNEYITDDTQAHCRYKNCVNTRWENIKYTGFRADGINGNPAGNTVINWEQMEVWNSGDIVNGVIATKVGAYHTNKLDMQGKSIIDNTVALRATAYPGGFIKFGSHLIKVVFYDASSNFISSETTAQTRRISLPLNCRYIQFVGYGIPATTPTYTFERYISVDTGISWWSTVRDCEFFENHRGGIANLGGGTLIDNCKFKDIGFSKLGFPNYGNTTIYAINFEDSYDDNLTVRDCEIDNMKQGVLFNGIDLKVKGCTFRNLEFMGVSPYGAASSIITGNTFENVTSVLNIARTAMTQRKKVIFSENTCKDSGLSLSNISDNPVHKVFILDNIWDGTKSRYLSSGSGGLFEISASKNVNFSGNLLQNLPNEGVLGVRFQNLAKMSDNTFIFDGSADRTQLRLFNITDGHANTVRTQSDSAAIESDFLTSGQIINFKGFNFVGSRGYKIVRTNKSKGWVDHKDVVEIRDCKFDGGNLIAEGFDGQNFYDMTLKHVGGSYENGAYFSMQTRETGAYAGSTCDIVFDGVTFDVTTATRIFYNTYALIGTVNIQFQNCTFVSDTVKSLAFIQGQTANITAVATNCRFLNVTNTDSILQLAGTAKTTYDPPSLANGVQQGTTVTLTGAKPGDNVNVSFDKPLSGTRMWGEVTSANTVTVYHRNDTGAVVDVPSGTLTVKIV